MYQASRGVHRNSQLLPKELTGGLKYKHHLWKEARGSFSLAASGRTDGEHWGWRNSELPRLSFSHQKQPLGNSYISIQRGFPSPAGKGHGVNGAGHQEQICSARGVDFSKIFGWRKVERRSSLPRASSSLWKETCLLWKRWCKAWLPKNGKIRSAAQSAKCKDFGPMAKMA